VLVLHSYTQFHQYNHSQSQADAVTYHPLKEGKIQQGISIDKPRLLEALRVEDGNAFEWLEPTTLVDTASTSVWYRPTRRRQLHLKAKKESIQFTVNFPSTLFIYHKLSRTVCMFALANDERPTLDAQLYLLPVGNVDGSGKLCLGSGASFLPETVNQGSFKEVERCFFEALSTHTSTKYLFKADEKADRNTSMQKLVNYWQKIAKQNTAPNVNKDFIQVKASLTTLIKVGR
jgi:PRTRC genetic system protein B